MSLAGKERLANAAAAVECRFRGLPRGQYSLKAGGREWQVLVNGNVAMDPAGNGAMPDGGKNILGVIIIRTINLAGLAIIARIRRKRD